MAKLVVSSKVKEEVKAHGCNTGGDFLDGLDKWIERKISQAAERAKSNGRKTLRAVDL